MIKKIIRALFFLSFGGLCAAGLFEGFLRVVELTPAWKVLPVAEVSLYGPNEVTAYAHRPNIKGIWTTENRAQVSTTSFGIRSNGLEEEDIEQRDGWYKVGFLGNSITEALQVGDNETFTALSEKILQERGQKIRVYNLGLSGSPPAVEAARARYFAEALDLDLIIILDQPENISHNLGHANGAPMPFYRENSDGDVTVDKKYLKSRGYRLRQSWLGEALYFMMDHVRIITVLNNRMNRGFFAELYAQNNNAPPTTSGGQCKLSSLSALADINKKEQSALKSLLVAFADDLSSVEKTDGTKIVYALYDTWEDCPQGLRDASYKEVKTIFNKKGITFLNLKEELSGNLQQGQTLGVLKGFGGPRGYGHLNHVGHGVFSRTLSEYIEGLR